MRVNPVYSRENLMGIPNNKYLGILCKSGHDWESTGKSLRHKSARSCIECHNVSHREARCHKPIRILREQSEKKSKDKKSKGLSDCYIKGVICSGTTLRHKDIPQELINLKRAEIKVKRGIKTCRT